MQIAVAQFAATTDVADNTESCMTLIADAAQAGADLVVLPEMAMYFDPRRSGGPGPHGQPRDGEFARAIADAARTRHIAVIVGMLEIADDTTRDYNTVLAFAADGDLIGYYRKIHLYDAFGFRESDTLVPGPIDAPLVVAIGGINVAVLTCYDLRFPEVFRWAVDAGAELVALPAAWIVGPAKERHWETLLAARAIENTIYLAGAGQLGPVGCGQSRIVDPMGTVIAGAGDAPGIALATVTTQRIEQVRRANPSLANRRFAVIPGVAEATRD